MKAEQAPANGPPLVLVYSAEAARYADLRRAVYAPLKHCGLSWRTVDLHTRVPSEPEMHGSSAVILAQEGIGRHLRPAFCSKLLDAVKSGVGLVILDPHLADYPPRFRRALGISRPRTADLSGPLKCRDDRHFVTRYQRTRGTHAAPARVKAGRANLADEFKSFIVDGADRPVAFGRQLEQGRVFVFGVSNRFWQPNRFGHGNGLTDVFWRGIVWAARKPFPALMFPPFVCARVDDAAGDTAGGLTSSTPASYPDWDSFPYFDYAAALRSHGYPCHAALFMNAVPALAARRALSLTEDSQAEFSPHAFSWGKGIYFNSRRGPYPHDLVRLYLDQAEQTFGRWELPLPAVTCPHLGECGSRAVLELYRRKRPFCSGFILPDEPFQGAHQDWRPAPFGSYGVVYDNFPQTKGLRYVHSGPVLPDHLVRSRRKGGGVFRVKLAQLAPARDFLWQRWRHPSARRRALLKDAALAAAAQVEWGLGNAFFGCLFTRESHIARFSKSRFEKILDLANTMLSDLDTMPARLSDICRYAWQWKDCNLDGFRVLPDGRIEFKVSGSARVRLKLSVFSERDGIIQRRFAELPGFEGGYQGVLRTSGVL